jgi:RecA/RadA recombinase
MAAKKSFKDRLQKGLTTIKSPTFNLGFSKINLYASTGNYALNRRLSNRFDRGYRFGRSVMLGGEPGSGKSLHAAYVCANAQKELGAHVIWVDIEKATDDGDGTWLKNLGVNLDELTFMRAGTVADCREILAEITGYAREERVKQKEDELAGKEVEPQQPIVIVFDSYSALITDTNYTNAIKGENVGDQGQRAKQVGDFIQSTTHLVDDLPVLLIGMVHIYMNQNPGEKEKLTAGVKAQFMASYILKMNKVKLTEEGAKSGKTDEEDTKKKKVIGITSKVSIQKSRFSKPFEEVQLVIPWDTGMDAFSGLFEVALQEGFIKQENASWYSYVDETGKTVKLQRTKFLKGGHADVFMKMAPLEPARGTDSTDTEEEETTETLEVEI